MAAAAGLMLAAVVFGGCGDGSSKDELSSSTAGTLKSTLAEVQQRVNVRDCSGASEQAAAFRAEVDALPDRVDGKLRRALESSADRLATLVSDQCTPEPAATPEEPPAGTTSEGQAEPQNQDDQSQNGKKDKKPKKEKAPKRDQTQTEPPPDTGGAGEGVPGVGDQGGGASPEG